MLATGIFFFCKNGSQIAGPDQYAKCRTAFKLLLPFTEAMEKKTDSEILSGSVDEPLPWSGNQQIEALKNNMAHQCSWLLTGPASLTPSWPGHII